MVYLFGHAALAIALPAPLKYTDLTNPMRCALVPSKERGKMKAHALFVDLPNFYSHLLRSGIDDPQLLRDYFCHWLDFDRVATKLTGESSPVWVFYSGKRLGPSSCRVDGKCLGGYVERINSLPGVTAYDVNIEGRQREPMSYKCQKCGHEGLAQWESEKGIDASLTVHLFDTMDTWDVAYILSADADFVPTVRSLRRRGKLLVGAGFSERSSALVRECYEYVDLSRIFLKEDVAAYEIFKEGGISERCLTDEVVPTPDDTDTSRSVRLIVRWEAVRADVIAGQGNLLSIDEVSETGPYYLVSLVISPPIELSNRHALIQDLQTRFQRHVRKMDPAKGQYQLVVSPLGWDGVRRRLEAFAASVDGKFVHDPGYWGGSCSVEYQYDRAAGRYVVVPPDDAS